MVNNGFASKNNSQFLENKLFILQGLMNDSKENEMFPYEKILKFVKLV